jgi:hypothetical protein
MFYKEIVSMGKTGFADQIHEGDAAAGTAPQANPLNNGVFDGTNVQRQKGDTSGRTVITTEVGAAVLMSTAGGPAPGQTIKSFTSSGGVSINTGATAISYTVTTGKTLFITDIDVSTDSATPILVQLKAGSNVVVEKYISTTCPLELDGIESQPTVASAQVFTLVFPTASGKNGTYFVSGYEQ